MVLLELFWSFVKIGFTSFGGLSMIPLISSEMTSHGWMSAEEIMDLVAIAEMTPGPMGINCATFAGIRAAGVPGAIAANLGTLFPTLTVVMLVAYFFQKWKDAKFMQHLLVGVRPVCMGLIAGIMVEMARSNYMPGGSLSWQALVIGAVSTLAFTKKAPIPLVLIISAVLGIVLVP